MLCTKRFRPEFRYKNKGYFFEGKFDTEQVVERGIANSNIFNYFS